MYQLIFYYFSIILKNASFDSDLELAILKGSYLLK